MTNKQFCVLRLKLNLLVATILYSQAPSILFTYFEIRFSLGNVVPQCISPCTY